MDLIEDWLNARRRVLKVGQIGTKHGHALGVYRVMQEHPGVDVVGCYEPDVDRRSFCMASGDWDGVVWLDSMDDLLGDSEVVAVASEGANRESLSHTEAIVRAGKHCFYDKPAGDDFHRFMRVMEDAKLRNLQVTLGYMFRKHDGFERISNWVRSGFLGHVFQIRAHMSTWLPERSSGGQFTDRRGLSYHRGGVLYDLGGHMLDQIVWMMGRPERVTSYQQNAASETRDFMDNTLSVLEYSNALVTVEIAAMEPRPMARRFEVYGTDGSAIMEPLEPAGELRLCLTKAKGGYSEGVTMIGLEDRRRYVDTFASFVETIETGAAPLRSYDHELLVQETLLRCTGSLAG